MLKYLEIERRHSLSLVREWLHTGASDTWVNRSIEIATEYELRDNIADRCHKREEKIKQLFTLIRRLAGINNPRERLTYEHIDKAIADYTKAKDLADKKRRKEIEARTAYNAFPKIIRELVEAHKHNIVLEFLDGNTGAIRMSTDGTKFYLMDNSYIELTILDSGLAKAKFINNAAK